MDFEPTEQQRLLRRQIVEFAEQELNDDVPERDRVGGFSRELWTKCGTMGLPGLCVPEEYGGIGLDPLSTAIALEGFGYGCHDGGLVFSVCAHLLACVVPIWKHADENLKRKYLPGLCDGSLIAVNGMTEPESGSDAFAMSTAAVLDGDGYRLRGTKIFASNGPVADVAIVYALTDPDKGAQGGVSAFVVERGVDGFRSGQAFEKMGLRTAPLGELVLDDAFVPAENLIGGPGAGMYVFSQSMEWERVCLVASHVGVMERLLERAVDYARTRKAFGQPIGKFQAVSHRITEMKVRLEAARLLTYRAASRLERARDVGLDASIAKLFVSESTVRSALDAVQVLGGYGYLAEFDVERALRDSVAGTLYSGTSEIQRNIIASWLGL